MKCAALFSLVALGAAATGCLGGGNGGGGTAASAGNGGVGGQGGSGGLGGAQTSGLPLLGSGQHSKSSVQIDVVATSADGIDNPRDLAFNPQVPGELWVLNRSASVAIIRNAGTPAQDISVRSGPGGTHFMAKPSALAFGAPGTMATAQEEDQITQPSTPAEFMGPTLWSTEYGTFNAGHASHIDMLHNSPRATGIAWDADNVFWVFDGMHGSITRYEFGADHGPGGADHSDGVVKRYVDGQVAGVPNVPSHMELDHSTGLLYASDSGNSRIVVLDTNTGSQGAAITPNFDGTKQFFMDGATITTVVEGAQFGLIQPAGLALQGGYVFVSDHANSKISAFTLTGQLVDWLETGLPPNSVTGLAFDDEGRLYVTDVTGHQVLRISAYPATSR